MHRKFKNYVDEAMARIDEIRAKHAAMMKEFVRLYGVKKTELLKELNAEEKMDNAKSMKTGIIDALIRQYERCAGSIGFSSSKLDDSVLNNQFA
jgi:hypothetical protein